MPWEIPKNISLLALAILFLFTYFNLILDAPRTFPCTYNAVQITWYLVWWKSRHKKCLFIFIQSFFYISLKNCLVPILHRQQGHYAYLRRLPAASVHNNIASHNSGGAGCCVSRCCVTSPVPTSSRCLAKNKYTTMNIFQTGRDSLNLYMLSFKED